jgi:hypothetical protein
MEKISLTPKRADKMQEAVLFDIVRLKQENERLREKIEENERTIRSLQKFLPNEPMPPAIPVLEPVCGREPKPEGEDIVPAITFRSKDGTLHMGLCRSSSAYTYVPVADGWAKVVPTDDE